MKTIACSAPYGIGGLGHHLAQIVEDARRRGELARYYSSQVRPSDDGIGVAVSQRLAKRMIASTPLRFSPGWRHHVVAELFDRAVADRLAGVEQFVGFPGESLRSFQAARRGGCGRLLLVAANSHINNVARRHQEARRRFGIERTWVSETDRTKTVREYDLADAILVGSQYSRDSFLAEGVDPGKLVPIEWRVDSRFLDAREERRAGDLFRVVYVGRLTVEKGIPVLRDAFARFDEPSARLTLVGGYGTRGMRKWVEEWVSSDPRVSIQPGDALPHLLQAHVCVHPAFEDGFAYAPMEALACGVRVIVSADTGMKERVREGVDGYVVPTGDSEAILERLIELARRE